MTKAVRPILALCAVAATVAVTTGCGGVSGNAVAEVDGTAIEKENFDRLMLVAAKSSGQPNAQVPDPPEYTKCVAAKRKTTPKPGKGQPKVTDSALKDQCKQEYEALRSQVLQTLLNYEWIEGEAEELDIKVSDAEVRKRFDQEKKQSFPKEADYKKFLQDYGWTEDDILQEVRLRVLSEKIREKVIAGKDKVSDAQIQDYYDKNKDRFAQPERRDLRVVLTKSKAKAEQAKAALDNGESWKSVAKEYSIDQASKSQGGKLPAQAEGTLEQALDKAVFAAKKGQIEGPVKTQFGHYVFEVEKIQKASQQSLDEAKETIRQTLVSQNQQKAIESFSEDFRKKWKERTDCREGYKTAQCKGEPDPTPTPQPNQPQQPAPPPQD
jgi:foldase protein PrsA